jgi:hypothetical protein
VLPSLLVAPESVSPAPTAKLPVTAWQAAVTTRNGIAKCRTI